LPGEFGGPRRAAIFSAANNGGEAVSVKLELTGKARRSSMVRGAAQRGEFLFVLRLTVLPRR